MIYIIIKCNNKLNENKININTNKYKTTHLFSKVFLKLKYSIIVLIY